MKKFYLMLHNLRDLPAELIPMVEAIAELATDLRWTWSHAGDAIWKAMDPQLWEQSENPFAIMQNLTRKRLEELNRSAEFKQHLERVTSACNRYNNRRGWFSDAHVDTALNGVAYFSMEFGLGQALPLYAGGLGVLAGDYLKAASDLVVPVTAIGLLYQEGYFRQVLDATGWQQEIYPYNDSTILPLRPVISSNGAWLQIPIKLPGRTVRLRVWEAQIGQVTLFLLDSNDPFNNAVDRGITSKLYGGGEELRFVQEIALGIAGWRLIEALDLGIDVCHLNEGHAAFVTLERARSFMQRQQVDFWEALWATRAGNVFTTHTPVAAGFDTFHRDLLEKYGLVYAESLGVDAGELIALGRCNAQDDDELFNMAYLAAHTCGRMNGVSRLHGKVSRKIFQDLYPRWPQQEVPVTHITNGVHVPSWDSPWADELWTRSCGKERWLGTEAELINMIETLDDETLWTFRGQERTDLIHHARQRLRLQLGQRGIGPERMERVDQVLDPNVLTLGFARRFTAYKRPNLLLCDPQRLYKLLTNPERPVQIIVAGKAHPVDAEGKRLIQEWVRFAAKQDVREHVVFLEDYDIALAQEMVQGIDVWINTPRRLWEASGTSGMKVLVNGGLNLSELDGWWVEAYTPEVGWAVGDGEEHDEAEWDTVEVAQLYRLLEDEIVPLFYDRDDIGIPREWVKRIRASMGKLAPYFSTNRMVSEYVDQFYLPAAGSFNKRKAQGGQLAKALRKWEVTLKHAWHETHLGQLVVRKKPSGWVFEVQVYLGAVSPEDVQVQLYADANSTSAPPCLNMQRHADIPGVVNGYIYKCQANTSRPCSDFTPRLVPYHPEANIPAENSLITWWSGQQKLIE